MNYKLLSYRSATGPRAGVLIGDTVFDAEKLSGKPDYVTVLGVLDDWTAADAHFAAVATRVASAGGEPLSLISLLAPILFPGQIFAAGANYDDHIDEMNKGSSFKTRNVKTQGGRPWFFAKPARSAVIGHGSTQPLPSYSSKVDWEIELAVVIGKTAARVPASEALNFVAGYTIANDLSARDFAARESTPCDSPFRFDWVSHKGFDGACPLGPWITPARDIPDPQVLALKLWVDCAEMQNSTTARMIFTVAEQIEELSARVTLHPGDVILTGTPAGVGMSRNTFLKPKQTVRLWIERIGTLQHGFD